MLKILKRNLVLKSIKIQVNIKDEKRKTRLNIRHAIAKHKTIEHRIYKSTTDYNKVLFAISQTLNIIKEGAFQNENN